MKYNISAAHIKTKSNTHLPEFKDVL